MIKNIFSTLAVLLIAQLAWAQQGKFEVLGYDAQNGCTILVTKKKKTGKVYYDSRVFGSPKFFKGYVLALNGEKVEGRIALIAYSKANFNFVKSCVLVIPDGKKIAEYIGPGVLAEVYIKKKKKNVYYDLYDRTYLERLVSGKIRLSYNPYANTSREVSSFVSQSFMDSVRIKTARGSIKKNLDTGKSLRESIGVANMKDQAIQALSSVEIVEKEYLIFDEAKQETILVTKQNYDEVISKLLSRCSSIDSKQIKKYSRSFKKIREAITAINSCS